MVLVVTTVESPFSFVESPFSFGLNEVRALLLHTGFTQQVPLSVYTYHGSDCSW